MTKQTEKKGFLSKIKSLPYQIMNRYVKSHDNTDDFQAMYSGAWFIAFLAMLVLSIICFNVDYDVLFGIEYTSSLDASYSRWSAVKSASIIQFLIIICGGLFFKILIFGKLKRAEEEQPLTILGTPLSVPRIDQKHLFQFIIFGLLFSYGFKWTLELSNKTYFSAKANAIGNQKDLELTNKEKALDLLEERRAKILELERSANKNIQSNSTHYDKLITGIAFKYEAKRANRKAAFEAGELKKNTLNKYLANYASREAKETALILKKKLAQITPVQDKLNQDIEQIRSTYEGYEKSLSYQASTARSELNNEIEATARETRGRNVTYNFINVLLMIGLLFFAKSSLDDHREPTDSEENTDGSSTTKNTNTKASHTTDTQQATQGKYSAKNTQKEPVITAQHSETQLKTGDYIEFEDVDTHTAPKTEYFAQDGYEFKREDGVVYIKHNKRYANLTSLNTWLKTYQKRVDNYTREGKIKAALRNAATVTKFSEKINYMKQNFVYAKSVDKNEKGTVRDISSVENKVTA